MANKHKGHYCNLLAELILYSFGEMPNSFVKLLEK